jgi:hypothetical protein
MGKKQKPAAGPTHENLIKALERVEKAAIPKEMRDADGGFATEGDGKELQVSASEGEPSKKVKKARHAESSHEEESDVQKADEESGEESSEESSSEESSDEESSPPLKMSKKGKGGKSVKKGKADESSEEHSPAETSSPELSGGEEESIGESPKPFKKKKGKSGKSERPTHSIKKSMMENEEVKEHIDASAFLEQLADSVSDAVEGLTKSVSASHKYQFTFNDEMAKAMSLMGGLVTEQGKQIRKLRKALANTPVVQRGKTLLNKGDVQEREFEQPEGASQALDEAQYRKSMDMLVQLASKGQVRPELVTEFEMTKSLDVLPPEVQQMIEGSLH